MRIAQGMLQPSFLRYWSCLGQPMRLALRKKFSKTVFSTSLSISRNTLSMSWYMLHVGSFSTVRNAALWAGKLLGPSPASLSAQSRSFSAFPMGSCSRYPSAVRRAVFFICMEKSILTPPCSLSDRSVPGVPPFAAAWIRRDRGQGVFL